MINGSVDTANYNYLGYNVDIIAFILQYELYLLLLIFLFVVLGGYHKDSLLKDTKIKISRILISSIPIAWGFFAFMEKIGNFKVVLLFSYICGFCYYAINDVLLSLSNNRKLFSKMFNILLDTVGLEFKDKE